MDDLYPIAQIKFAVSKLIISLLLQILQNMYINMQSYTPIVKQMYIIFLTISYVNDDLILYFRCRTYGVHK